MSVATQNSLSKIEQQREHFNSISQQYYEGRQEKTHILLKKLIWQMAFNALPAPKDGSINVLEPMCGYAEGYDLLQEHYTKNITYQGFDYSNDIVEQISKSRPDLEITQEDVTQYRPEHGKQDIIILIGGLHHVPNQAREVVTNMSHALKPGGFFVNFEPTSGNPLFKAVRDKIYNRNKIFDAETERAFGVDELSSMFLEAGLEKHKILYPGLLAYIMYYNPYAFPWLNIGGTGLMKAIYAIDKLFFTNIIGRTMSFATLSIWKKP